MTIHLPQDLKTVQAHQGVLDDDACREYRLRFQVFSRWRQEFPERAADIFATQAGRGDEQARIAGLEQTVVCLERLRIWQVS